MKSLCYGLLALGLALLGKLPASEAQVVALNLAAAQEPSSDEPRQIFRLQIEPAAATGPALKYPLLPPIFDQTIGNAATLYYRAELTLIQNGGDKLGKQAFDWLEMPIAEMPRAEVVAWLPGIAQILEEVRTAARRDHCDWDLPLKGNADLFSVRLQEVQEMRNFARLLSIQARMQMLDGDFAAASQSLQTGFAMARHVNEVPLVIAGLVGTAKAAFMVQRILELVEQPGSPNLYWSLTALPTPLVDLRPGLEFEVSSTVYTTFPFLRDPEKVERTPEQWQALLEAMVGKLIDWGAFAPAIGNESKNQATVARTVLAGLALKGYPRAREHLEKKGFSAERIAGMSVGQAIAISVADLHDEYRDEVLKRQQLSPWETYQKAGESARRLSPASEIIPVVSFLLPPFENVLMAQYRLDAKIAELRLIEAIRQYAATHDRTLPKQLSDITEVPVPTNPLTGREYPYRLDGSTAFIEIPAPRGFTNRDYGKRYELTIRPGTKTQTNP
jgi:hypothetical protein